MTLEPAETTRAVESLGLELEAVMFDLDGTLTDPKLGITKSVQYALAKYGIEVADRESLTVFIGPPLTESFERYYGFSHEQAKQAVEFYREYFGITGLYENELFPGIPDLLSSLKKRGIAVGVATSKASFYAEQIVRHFGLDPYIDVLVGSNLDHTRVAKAEVIAFLREENEPFRTEKIVMIGDREHDVLGAKAHGVSTIGVSFGYGSHQELEAAGAIAIADSVADLARLLGS